MSVIRLGTRILGCGGASLGCFVGVLRWGASLGRFKGSKPPGGCIHRQIWHQMLVCCAPIIAKVERSRNFEPIAVSTGELAQAACIFFPRL
jgi:hypothetical protein